MKEKFANIWKEVKDMNVGVIVAVTQFLLTTLLTILTIIYVVNVHGLNGSFNVVKNYQRLDVIHSVAIWLIFFVLLSVLVLIIQLFVNNNQKIKTKKYRLLTLGNGIFIVAIILVSYFANAAKDLNSVARVFELLVKHGNQTTFDILVEPLYNSIFVPYISLILLLVSGYFQGFRLFKEKEISVDDVVTNSKKVAQKSKEAFEKVAEMDKKAVSATTETPKETKKTTATTPKKTTPKAKKETKK